MNKRSVLALSLFTASLGVGLGACSDSNGGGGSGSGGSPSSGGTGGSAGMPAAGSSGAPGGAPATSGGVAGNATSGGSAGSSGGGSAGAAATSGSGGMCDVPSSLEVFARSDSDQSWDDNDFDSVMLNVACPVVANVTWPHEANWENADPSEANREQTHFTIDSYYSTDLTNKQISLTIELTADQRGPTATAGGYIISLVSVSQDEKVVSASGGAGGMAGGSDMGGMAGNAGGGASAGGGAAGSAGVGAAGGGAAGAAAAGGGAAGAAGSGVAGGGVAGMDGSGGATQTTTTVYYETESKPEERGLLRRVGDRVTVTLNLKKEMADSYDPAKVIKINFRIYSQYTTSSQMMGMGGAGGMAGIAGAAGGGAAGAAGGGAAGAAGAAGGGAAGAPAGGAGEPGGAAGAATAGAGNGGSSGTMPVFDYLTSQFTITNFSVKDASTP